MITEPQARTLLGSGLINLAGLARLMMPDDQHSRQKLQQRLEQSPLTKDTLRMIEVAIRDHLLPYIPTQRQPRVHVLNALAMQGEGVYRLEESDALAWGEALGEYDPAEVISHIGYPENLRVIEDVAEISLPLLKAGMEHPVIEPGDRLFFMRLRRLRRIPKAPDVEHFEFYEGWYYG